MERPRKPLKVINVKSKRPPEEATDSEIKQ